jgi:hypothetical protein
MSKPSPGAGADGKGATKVRFPFASCARTVRRWPLLAPLVNSTVPLPPLEK